MKQKLFTLLTLALFFCGGAWGQTEIFSAVPIATSDVSSSETAGTAFTSSQATISGGTMSMMNTESSSRRFIVTSIGPSGDKRKAFQINAAKAFFKIVLDEALADGDVISADVYNNNVALWLSTATSRPSSAPTTTITCGSTSSVWADGRSYTVETGDGICGEKTFYIYRNSNSTSFTNFKITRTDTNSPNITKDLRSVYAANVGTPTILSITAEHAYSYQWYKDDAEIDGATSSSYAYTPTAVGSAEFYCVATNSNASGTKTATSATATVTAEAALHGETISWTTNTSAANEYQNTYSTTYFENLSVTKGSSVSYEANRDHCLLNESGDPEESVDVCRFTTSAVTNNTLTFAFEVKDGYVFNPSSVSFVGTKQGTDGAVTLDAKWTAEGESDIELGSALALKRASSSGTYATPGGERFTYNLGEKGAASTTSCALVLTLNTSGKAYGIGDIQVTGTLSPIEEVTMTADYGTFCSTDAVNFSDDDDLTIYKVQISGSSAVLTPVDSKLVPANTGVLLKKEGGGAITGKVIGSAPAIADNDFKAATTAKTQADATSGYDIYVLNKEASAYGFFKLSASGTLAAGKAYIEMPESFVGARLSFVFEDEETTAIDAVRSHQTISNNEYFNLAGQRVAQPTKGLYIVNGKKVIIK